MLGGTGIAAGAALILFVRALSQNPNVVINREAYAMLHVIGLVLIFLGILGASFGFLAIRHSHKLAVPPPP